MKKNFDVVVISVYNNGCSDIAFFGGAEDGKTIFENHEDLREQMNSVHNWCQIAVNSGLTLVNEVRYSNNDFEYWFN